MSRELEDVIVFCNGSFIPASKAGVSIFDRGFLYGDGLFGTMRAYKGHVFALEEHLKRLKIGAKDLKIPVSKDASLKPSACKDIISKLLKLNKLDKQDSYIRLTLTRGIDYGGLMPKDNPQPTMIITVKPIASDIQKKQKAGISAVTVDFSKTHSKTSSIKSLNFLDNVIGSMIAKAHGAEEAVFLNPAGEVLEGAISNVFIVKDGVIKTPSLKSGILSGITRRTVIDISKNIGIQVKEAHLKTFDILKSDEAFITNSIIEIVPLLSLNNKPIGKGRPGKTTRLLQIEYKRHAQIPIPQNPI